MANEKPGGGENEKANLPPIDIQRIQVPIQHLSPLIMHAWSHKAIKMMLDKQTKRATQAKEAKDPEQDYLESMYKLPDGTYGFPANGFKNAIVRAGTYTDSKMTFLRGALYINGDDDGDKLVRIEGEPQPREDMVRVGQGTADIRYRAEFPQWKATLRVEFNARAISAEQVVNLISVAGFSVGVGDWRPEKDGTYGRFEVVSQ